MTQTNINIRRILKVAMAAGFSHKAKSLDGEHKRIKHLLQLMFRWNVPLILQMQTYEAFMFQLTFFYAR